MNWQRLFLPNYDTMTKSPIIESHPFAPWLPENARLLMCGTFPPKPNRWRMEFYYPNFINDMWRIFGLICHGNKNYFVDEANKTFKLQLIKEMLSQLGIALSDTGREAIRLKDNASDKFLEIVRPIDLDDLLMQLPYCNAIATTGEKAAEQIADLTHSESPRIGEYTTVDFRLRNGDTRMLHHWRMPSSSRAYPLKLESKAACYNKMLIDESIITDSKL